jgi:hypothetical protein
MTNLTMQMWGTGSRDAVPRRRVANRLKLLDPLSQGETRIDETEGKMHCLEGQHRSGGGNST